MECFYCECNLILHDAYGYFAQHQNGKKLGDIYKCEKCDIFYHTDNQGNLKEGYPC